jgi:membrane protease subunit (stomatin/prohibitin family)
MAIIDLIQLPNQYPDEVVRRVPETGSGEFRLGSQLVVREDQRAVFMRDGKALDVFGPGRHTISTNNLPFLSRLIGWPFGGDSPFTAEVYFVSMREFTDMKWGTTQPMTYRDKEFGMVRLRAFGGYSAKVSDPQLMVGSIVGSRGVYSIGQLDDHLKGLIINEFNDLLGDTHTSLLDLPGMTKELAQTMQAALTDSFRRVGLQLLTFQISSITPPEDVQKAIDQRTSMGAIGDMGKFVQYQTGQAIGDAARNPGDGGSAMATGAGFGAGAAMGQAMAQSMQGALNPPKAPEPVAPAVALIPCPGCGQPLPAGAKFCPNCGQRASSTVTCPKCQAENPAGAKFCTECGTGLSA